MFESFAGVRGLGLGHFGNLLTGVAASANPLPGASQAATVPVECV